MTPQETIKNLKKLKSFHNGSYGTAIDMAIKALEQQPNDDCISRAEAIKIIKEHPSIVGNRSTIVQKIVDLPSVTPKARWITVKWHIKTEVEEYEQYPEGVVMLDCPIPTEGEDVLITIKGKSGQVWVEKDTALKDEDGWYTDGGHDWIDDIIAWMPLPQPYTESEDDVQDE